MEILGYIAAVFIGISLGMIGGGGSILTVPVLVYLMGVDPVLATAYSLFIVGSTSLVGGIQKHYQGFTNTKNALIFGGPAIIGVYSVRKYVMPSIPDDVGVFFGIDITKGLLVMLMFAILMVVASVTMIRSNNNSENNQRTFNKTHWYTYVIILLEGLVVGAITGFVGAGGGFLIIPALVLITGLPMKQAVGTSLIIIAAKSLIGFLGDMSNEEINWTLLAVFTGLAITGIFVGSKLSQNIEGAKLKKAFGWFVLVMGIYIIARELMNA
jgi:uncharacterized protein